MSSEGVFHRYSCIFHGSSGISVVSVSRLTIVLFPKYDWVFHCPTENPVWPHSLFEHVTWASIKLHMQNYRILWPSLVRPHKCPASSFLLNVPQKTKRAHKNHKENQRSAPNRRITYLCLVFLQLPFLVQ